MSNSDNPNTEEKSKAVAGFGGWNSRTTTAACALDDYIEYLRAELRNIEALRQWLPRKLDPHADVALRQMVFARRARGL